MAWMVGFIALIHRTGNYRQYSAMADLHTLQFTVTQALGFSVLSIRILATDFNTVIIPVSL
jgi:DNA-binding transcriptional MerR regulator